MEPDNSSYLEPTYLRYIYDGLIKGSIHPENAAELPEGLIGLYEEGFDERISVVQRQKHLQLFAFWALLKKEVSTAFVAEVLGETEESIQEFISTYSPWFNSPESGKYQLYHERLKVYLLQKFSEDSFQSILKKMILTLSKESQSDEIKSFTNEWKGFYFLLNGDLKIGLQFLEANLKEQDANWWEHTFDLYCNCIFSNQGYQISNSELEFYAKIRGQHQCLNAAKLVVINFEHIPWDDFDQLTQEARFHYLLAEVFNKYFDKLSRNLVEKIILDESHYLSYILAYAWKYNSWENEDILYKSLIQKIKLTGSPYLRILLRQIDGGRLMLKKSPILKTSDYNDCWEYLSEDFLNCIQIGTNNLLQDFYTDTAFIYQMQKQDLLYVLADFDSLHIQIDKLRSSKNQIYKSPYFFKIIEIFWLHPAWEIGEFGNDLVRNKIKGSKDENQLEAFKNWIYHLAKAKNTYSIAILIFDIIEVIEVSDAFVNEIIDMILEWKDAQVRGQFIASANEFFMNNHDERWLRLFKKQLYRLCSEASDIWETQALIELLETLKERITSQEFNDFNKMHKLLNTIPNACELDWQEFWKTAEQLRLKGVI
jgi:hypothetical protein